MQWRMFIRMLVPVVLLIISPLLTSDLPGVKATGARDWLDYDGPWGPYEKLSYTGSITILGTTQSFTFAGVGNGPPGPVR